jgi:hypothetical protein
MINMPMYAFINFQDASKLCGPFKTNTQANEPMVNLVKTDTTV